MLAKAQSRLAYIVNDLVTQSQVVQHDIQAMQRAFVAARWDISERQGNGHVAKLCPRNRHARSLISILSPERCAFRSAERSLSRCGNECMND
jgi:hypothetical protein